MVAAPYAQDFAAEYVGGTIFVDNVYGSDVTGKPYRADFPFASIAAANLNSQWGDLVSVALGTGYYDDPINLVCMAGRSYAIDPMVLLVDNTLTAPPQYFYDLALASSTTVTSHTLALLQTDLLVGRELVILGQISSGSEFTPGRYKIMSVASGVMTLNAPVAGYTGATSGGYGYLAPGPMYTQLGFNGQYDGLIQAQRFNDNQVVVPTTGTPTTVPLLYQDSFGTTPVTTASSPIALAKPELFADGVTPWLANTGSNLDSGGSGSYVTWTGPISGSGGGTAKTQATTSFLSRTVTTTAPSGTSTMIFTTRYGSPVPSMSESGRLCGMAASGMNCYAGWTLLTGACTVNFFTGSGSYSAAVASPATMNAYAVMQESSSGSSATKVYVGNTTSPATNSNANTATASGVSNYIAGWNGTDTLTGLEVGHYLFFDGAISQGKLYAWINALLQDYGLYTI